MKLKTTLSLIFKAIAFAIALAVLLPSVVKLTHAFTHHHHQTCDGDVAHNTHFHKLDLDCEFYKFKLSEIHYFDFYNLETKLKPSSLHQATHYYISYHSNQQLTRFLRGPPELV